MPVTFSCPCCFLTIGLRGSGSVQGSNPSTQRTTRSSSSMFGSFFSALSCFKPVQSSAPSRPTTLDEVWKKYRMDYKQHCLVASHGAQNDGIVLPALQPPKIITEIRDAYKIAVERYNDAIKAWNDEKLPEESRLRFMSRHEDESTNYYKLIEMEQLSCYASDGMPIRPVDSKYLHAPVG